ncbi:hypothetical protein UAJ10_27410 [Nitrospirillum sp. BR 11164]|uniref:hypothetical protein n=1 Tax=Nitrospirillum sp. BR 11164 TaxID=3104324 RepID=UPI002AFED553|nr:hypothetical protein [Nitrospirillum sp. BR 11164]MEA1652729.1 hypothetical protein [Nitrospirillum sp. BR 11164]
MKREQFEQLGQEVAAAIAVQMRERGLLLADFPRLTDDGGSRRAEAVLAGRGKGSVNLPAVLKRFVRRDFPDFNTYERDGDAHRFEKRMSPDFRFVLIFERRHFGGLGKAFTVHLSCGHTTPEGRTLRWRHSLLSFFERSLMHWIYGHEDELEACLQEVAMLLRLTLPAYEALWLPLHQTGRSALLEELPSYGPLSFHEAADLASRALAPVYPQLTRLTMATISTVTTPGAYAPSSMESAKAAAATGRLAPGLTWLIHFEDLPSRRAVWVGVPYRGTLAFMVSNTVTATRNGLTEHLTAAPDAAENLGLPAVVSTCNVVPDKAALWRTYLDSTIIGARAMAAGGRIFFANARMPRFFSIYTPIFASRTPRRKHGTFTTYSSCRIGGICRFSFPPVRARSEVERAAGVTPPRVPDQAAAAAAGAAAFTQAGCSRMWSR